MSLPQDKFVSVSSVVQSPAFTVEKKHLILAMANSLITTTNPVLEFKGSTGLTNFASYFGQQVPEYKALQKYFGFISKKGTAPEKAIIVRWYKENAAPFIKGSKLQNFTSLKAVTDGSFKLTLNDTPEEISGLDFTAVNSYSDIATIVETAIKAKTGETFTNASFEFNSITGGFILTGGVAGLNNTISIDQGSTGTDVSLLLGLLNREVSEGVNAETFAELCDRIYNLNPAGFAITTLEDIEEDDIQNSVSWLNTLKNEQSLNTKYKLIFNFSDKTKALAISSTLSALKYTGYVLTYDPYGEYINILDAAIGASIDFEVDNAAINFNFQDVSGYTAITNLDTPVDYQTGKTNLSLTAELDEACISYVYSVGVGSQQVICYGLGLLSGALGTEDTQINESWLEAELKTATMNGLIALDKLPLQGESVVNALDAIIAPVFIKGVKNGVIADGGTLLDNDKLTVIQNLGSDAVEAIENNGYYYKIQSLNAEDIKLKRVRIVCAYIASGVINFVRIINNIYGV